MKRFIFQAVSREFPVPELIQSLLCTNPKIPLLVIIDGCDLAPRQPIFRGIDSKLAIPEQLETATKSANPKIPSTVFMDCGHPFERLICLLSIVRKYPILKTAEYAIFCGRPDCRTPKVASPISINGKNDIPQSISHGVMSEVPAPKPVETLTSANPEASLAVFINTARPIVGQSLFRCECRELPILEPVETA